MRLLLDTHTVLWWRMADRRLSDRARAEIGANHNTAWVSVASVWEAAIKFAAGRLRLPKPPAELLSNAALGQRGIESLSIRDVHALAAGALPRHHADPFDRMLIAQAQVEDLTIVTSDAAFDQYDVRVLDART